MVSIWLTLKNISCTSVCTWFCVLVLSYRNHTWNRGVESTLNPSEPGCLTKEIASGSSIASFALKSTSPKLVACVSGWALSYKVTEEKKKTFVKYRFVIPRLALD